MPVMYAMLSNAAVAAVLALLALGLGRVCRSPAVRHFLWVLVLLKLVTPPVFPVPLAILPAVPSDDWRTGSVSCRVEDARCPAANAAGSPYPADNAAGSPAPIPSWWERWRIVGAEYWIFAVWIVGATGWFIWQGRRIVRFRRRVGRAVDAGPEAASAAHRIAKELAIAHPPAVKAATGIGSPMLWGWGRGTFILFPRELLARLGPEARDTLLAHELVHFLRRDHWVRVLEFVATGIYWWHPAVWVARLGIESAEEECCDAWVVGGLAASPRRYAEALLATIDFVAELQRPCLPPGACPANRDAQLLYHRLTRIAHAETPHPLRGGVVVRAAALAVLLVHPILRPAKYEAADLAPASVETVGRADEVGLPRRAGKPTSSAHPTVPPPAEPPAWASAPAPGGAVTAMARDNEVVLRRPDGTVQALGPGKPIALAFAPNGQQLATAGPGPLVRIWDYWGNSLAEAKLPAAARGIAYSPDGSGLLILDAAGGIWVRNPHTLAPISNWSVEGPANSITCSPDSQVVAVAFGSWLDAETGWVEFWSIADQRKLANYSASAPVGATRFAPDGGMLVIGGWNGLLAWRRLPEGELVAERQLPKKLVAAASFSPDAGTLPLDPPPKPPAPASPIWPLSP